jgi:hypothetical protein
MIILETFLGTAFQITLPKGQTVATQGDSLLLGHFGESVVSGPAH